MMTKEQAIQDNQGLVMKLARRYKNNRVEFLDLVQAGNLGLLDAFERYDKKKSNGGSFFTYAYYWVKKRIKEEIANSHIVKIPPHIQNIRNNIAKAKALYNVFFGESPDEAELAAMLDTTEDEIAKTNFRCDVNYFSDLNNVPAQEEVSRKHEIAAFIKDLPEKEMFVLFSRQAGLTLEKIGKELGGLCRERVRQIEKDGLNRIKKRFGRTCD